MGRASLAEFHLLFSCQSGWSPQWAEAGVETSSKEKLCWSGHLLTQGSIVVGNKSKGKLHLCFTLVHQLSDGLNCSLHSPIARVVVRAAGDVMDLGIGTESFEGMRAEAGSIVRQECLKQAKLLDVPLESCDDGRAGHRGQSVDHEVASEVVHCHQVVGCLECHDVCSYNLHWSGSLHLAGI